MTPHLAPPPPPTHTHAHTGARTHARTTWHLPNVRFPTTFCYRCSVWERSAENKLGIFATHRVQTHETSWEFWTLYWFPPHRAYPATWIDCSQTGIESRVCNSKGAKQTRRSLKQKTKKQKQKLLLVFQNEIQTYERFKNKTKHANFRGNPLYQATKPHLNNS